MKNTLMMVTLLSLGFIAKAQVGINNQTPQATLDVTGKPTETTVMDGIIPPRIDGAQLRAKTYTTAQTGALVYVNTADTSPSGQTAQVTAAGYYYFNGTVWTAVGSGSSSSTQLYQNIRGGVTTVTATSYTLQPNDYVVVTNAAAAVTITLPNLTAADAGRTVLLYNNNTVAQGNVLAPATPFPAAGLTSNLQGRGRTLTWTGTTWLVVGT
jgi:hypothetical protein